MSTTSDVLGMSIPQPHVDTWKNGMNMVSDDLDTIDDAFGDAFGDMAPVELSSTATANHAVGTYLVMGGTLYKVTSAIATGETIAAGTNVTATTLNDAIVELNTAVATLQESVGVVSAMPIMSVFETNDLNDIRAWIMKPIVSSANLPSEFNANNCIVLSFGPSSSNYNAQLAFSFGTDKMAIRRRYNSTTWTSWKYFTAS